MATTVTATQNDLIADSRGVIASLREYFTGDRSLSLKQFEGLLDHGQQLRDQLESEIFSIRDQEESAS